MKKLFILILISIFSLSAKAQADGVYRIKLMTVNKASDLRLFNNLKDLGVIEFEPYLDKYRVYLGNYIGKFSAEKVLPTVIKRGFIGSYVEKSPLEFKDENGDSLTHTLQFIALKRLDIRTIVNNPKLDSNSKMFIWYHNGFYRISIGLVNEKQTEEIAKYQNTITEMGFKTSFTQKYAGVKPVPEKEKPVINNPKNLFPEIKEIKKKDIFELENKKSNSDGKENSSGLNLDFNYKPKQTTINPNAKLKPIKSDYDSE